MRARKDIVLALRCSATCGEPLDCTGCPYLLEDKDENGVRIQDCNTEAIFRDAIERLETDEKTISAVVEDRNNCVERYERLKSLVPLYNFVPPGEGTEDDEA